jgi:peptidyl-prolyl cis-trans isomerase D
VLQQMRSAAKYIWIVLVIAFVGGYLFLDLSGLLGTQAVTSGTSVGKVDGTDITYAQWIARTNALLQQQEQAGRTLDRDDRAALEDRAFDDLVMEIILKRELDRRHIVVTDEEIKDAARHNPPPYMLQLPDLQTEGRFDPAKWERFLASPAVRQQGLLNQLEMYYRDMLPQAKLQGQLASEVYVSDAQLWRTYQDLHDTAVVSFVAFRPAPGADSAARTKVSDSDVAAYYNAHKNVMRTQARAIVTALVISRTPTTADTAAARARAEAARQRITRGEKFEDVAKEVSEDSVSAAEGGKLPATRFVPEFEDAARKLRRGQVSEPVRTQFGWHIIRLDSLKGDTVSAHHILIRIRQGDAAATATDRLADTVAKIAANAEDGRRLDSAVVRTGLPAVNIEVIEGQRALAPDGTTPLAGLSQWATSSGARVGEVSELFDSDDAYFIARIDSIVPGGEAPLSRVREDIRLFLARKQAIEDLKPRAAEFARAALSSSFEAAAKAADLKVEQTGPFTRMQFVPGLGQATAPIGAAFTLASGAISEPVASDDGVYVIRVDRRVPADRTAWLAQRDQQREQILRRLEEDRWRQYIGALRDAAKVVDNRKKVLAASRRQQVQ